MDAVSKELLMNNEADDGVGGHRYNDDLLLTKEARARAQQEHATVFHILDHEQLRQSFRHKNDEANRQKRNSHVAGFWAVVTGFIALAGAASEPLWGHLAAPLPWWFAIALAALGLLSFIIGKSRLMYGKRKSAWLYSRLYTERLRQFHFQSFIWRLPEIAESLRSGADAHDAYRAKRDQWFNRLEDELKTNSNFQMLLLQDLTAVPKIWLHSNASNVADPIVPDEADVDLKEVFRAYEVFRFDEQQGYVWYMLRPGNMPDTEKDNHPRRWQNIWRSYPGDKQPLRAKRKALAALWVIALAAMVLMHVLVMVSHIGGWERFLGGSLTHVAIVWAALLVVAVKTLSEGFALTREIERYEEYRAVVGELKRAFCATESPQRKLQIMMEMEKASFEEMRVFLRSHQEATFIM